MSKNFEQAYKELAQKETPDLWDRIEAGLTEKSAPKKTDISKDIGKDIQKQIVSDKPDEVNTGKSGNKEKTLSTKIRVFAGKYTGIAAAVLCLAVILPAAVFLKRSGEKSFSGGMIAEGSKEAQILEEEQRIEETQETEEAAADMAMPEETEKMEEAAQPEAAAAVENGKSAGGTADAGTADGGAGTETAENALADMGEAWAQAAAEAEEDVAGSDSLSAAKLSGEKQEAGEDEEAKKTKVLEAGMGMPLLPAGTVLEEIVVEITDMSVRADENAQEEPGNIYTVLVKEDPSGTLQKDSKIEVFVPAYASFFLPVGESCVIDIACLEEGEYPVVQKKR